MSAGVSSLKFPIERYCGVPWKVGGRGLDGADCAGIADVFLRENFYPDLAEFPATPATTEGKDKLCRRALASGDYVERNCGDLVLFRKRGRICHCEVYLGNGQYLSVLRGSVSRIVNGLTLIQRLGFERVGAIPVEDVDGIVAALRLQHMGDIGTVVALIVSVVISLAAAFLMPKPTMGKNKPQVGRYSYDSLITRSQSDIPLPDVLGAITVAGNSPYTTAVQKAQPVDDPTQQKANKVVILSSGPIAMVDTPNGNLKINGIQYSDPFFKSAPNISGFTLAPAQTRAEAVDGSILGATNVPSITIYEGDYDVSVPIDIRASYDRSFPLYGFSGCSYIVLRLIDSTKFDSFNLTSRIYGRLVRDFDANGFIQKSVFGEALTGANGTKVRFLMNNYDVIAVTALTVNGVSYSPISATSQTGNVYSVNKTKGYIEFVTAPASGAAILVSYTCYSRIYTDNPAKHVAYLLTEPVRGKGYDASSVDWASFDAARQFYNQPVAWTDDSGFSMAARYTCGYSIDARKPIQEHMQAVLDACYSWLFFSNGKWTLKPRTVGSSVFSFNTTNIVKDSFYVEEIDRTERANQVRVVIHPDTTYNAEDGVVRDDLADQQDRAANFGNGGIVPAVLEIPASPNDAQSARLGEQVLRENIRTGWMCGLTTNVQGLALEVGDIVDVTHPLRTDWVQKLFRIENVDHDEHDRLQLVLSEYVAMAYI